MIWTRVLLVVAMWALVLPRLASVAQDAEQTGDVPDWAVAQGIMAMPAETMVWQSELQRAVVAPQAESRLWTGGFIVADSGALAITDAAGKVLQLLAPGGATWIEPGASRAIVSLEDRSVGYLSIGLIPAGFVAEDPGAASHGEPFPVPAGMVELSLLGDTLERGEENIISSGNAPAFLQVTSGKVYVSDESGGISEVAAGSPLQFVGQITLSGGSRTTASMVVARLGPQVPLRLPLQDPDATPITSGLATPIATPYGESERAEVLAEGWLCPPGYDESAPLLSCTSPAVGVRFSVESEGESTNVLADETGVAAFPDLNPGAVTLQANLPEGATTALTSCFDIKGNAVGRVRGDAVALSLSPGDSVRCSWFIETGEVWPAASLSVAVLECPPGMTEEALHAEFCVASDSDTALQLGIEDAELESSLVSDGVWVWGPLLERDYDLTLTGMSPGFSGYVLEDGETGEEGEPVEIDLGDDPAPVRTLYLLQPLSAYAAEIDSDADLLHDAQEFDLGTDPYVADSDQDGLVDGDEVGFYGTDPLQADTDDDGLPDQEEVAVSFTNPFLPDTDGDGANDADEVAALTNPLDLLSQPPTPTPEPTATPLPSPTPTPVAVASPVAARSTPMLSADATPVVKIVTGLAELPTLPPDASPISYGTPLASNSVVNSGDPARALDDDGLSTLDEISIHGTDPVNSDTDGDGTSDGEEVASGRDPLDAAN